MAASFECLKLSAEAQNNYNEIVKAKCAATPWVLFTYAEEDDATLVLLEEGATRNDFIANLSSDKVIFGLLRIADNKPNNLRGKMILVYWIGPNSELDVKGKSQQHYERDVQALFSKSDGFITIEHEGELDVKLRAILINKDKDKSNGAERRSVSDSDGNEKTKRKFISIHKRKSRIRESTVLEDSPTPSKKSIDEIKLETPSKK